MTTLSPPIAASTTSIDQAGAIGVFDSGVGGLSVLSALQQRLPHAPKIYIGDVSHAPYGELGLAEILDRSERIVTHLADCGARLIVIACNTVTVLAIERLRRHWPGLTFVGVEPGVKPAATRSRSGRIAVLATPTTARSARLRQLIDRHASSLHVHVQPCPGLAGAIEAGTFGGPALLELLNPICQSVLGENVDTVVLGCTHYPFVAEAIQVLLGEGVTLIDTGAAVALRVESLWSPEAPVTQKTSVRVLSTGAPKVMGLLLKQCAGLQSVEIEQIEL